MLQTRTKLRKFAAPLQNTLQKKLGGAYANYFYFRICDVMSDVTDAMRHD